MTAGHQHIRSEFSVAPGTIYMDAATYGLPPRSTLAVVEEALQRWSAGTADWIEDWDRPADDTRALFGDLAGVPADSVALLPSVSVGVGYVAATLGPGDEVLLPGAEYTSVSYPLQVAGARGVRMRRAPIGELAEAVAPDTQLIATSLVQMQTGLRVDLPDLLEAASRVEARVLIDATQAIPFIRPDEDLSRVDYVLAHSYKHLLCPRGATFMAIRPDRLDGLHPVDANWRAAGSPYGDYFNEELSLGQGARAFDISLAWLSWVGARESLRLLREWRDQGAIDGVWSLAQHLSMAAGLGAPASTLVCLPVADTRAAGQALRDAGIKAAVRGAAVRLSAHVWNDQAEVDRALEALGRWLP